MGRPPIVGQFEKTAAYGLKPRFYSTHFGTAEAVP